MRKLTIKFGHYFFTPKESIEVRACWGKLCHKRNAVIRTRGHVSVRAWLKILLNFEKLDFPRDVQLSNWSSIPLHQQSHTILAIWHLEYLHLTWIPGWPLTTSTWSLTLPLILIIFKKSNSFPTRCVSYFIFLWSQIGEPTTYTIL